MGNFVLFSSGMKVAKKGKKRTVSESSSSNSDYGLESDSDKPSMDYFSFGESETEIDEDLDFARVWLKIDASNVPCAPPRFFFVGSP